MKVELLVEIPGKPKQRMWATQSVVIGREEGSVGLRINSRDVSRRHCHLLIVENAVAIKDLDSRNGTLVNGFRVPDGMQLRLSTGDVIGIGPVQIKIGEVPQKKSKPKPVAHFDSSMFALNALEQAGDDSSEEMIIDARFDQSDEQFQVEPEKPE